MMESEGCDNIENISKEIEAIRNVLKANIEEDIDDYSYFHIGEFVEQPNQSGCFKRESKWYTYEIDEKNDCTFCGPFSQKGVIYACTMLLPVSMKMREYRFTEEEFDIYLHNHFHSFDEIDRYLSNK